MRPSWDEHFLGLATYIGQSRATCDRGKCGAVAVLNNREIATGYVGAPSGLPHCSEVGHLFSIVDDVKRCVRTIHAEQNLLVQSAITGVPLVGATVYSTMEPCITCAQLLVAVGIERFVAQHTYHAATNSRILFEQSGIALDVMNDTHAEYEPTLPGFVGMLKSDNLSSNKQTWLRQYYNTQY